MTELKGHEETKGATPRQGRRARRATRAARPGPSSAPRKRRDAGLRRRSPTCVIIGGGQGGIALGARLRRLGVPTIIVEKNDRARRQLAQPLQVALPARPGLVRPPALPALPRRLAGVRAQGQDRRLAGDVHEGHGAELLGARPTAQEGARYDEATQEWPCVVERDGKDGHAAARSSWCSRTGMSGYAERAEDPGRRDASRATSTIPASTPAPTPTRARSAW